MLLMQWLHFPTHNFFPHGNSPLHYSIISLLTHREVKVAGYCLLSWPLQMPKNNLANILQSFPVQCICKTVSPFHQVILSTFIKCLYLIYILLVILRVNFEVMHCSIHSTSSINAGVERISNLGQCLASMHPKFIKVALENEFLRSSVEGKTLLSVFIVE